MPVEPGIEQRGTELRRDSGGASLDVEIIWGDVKCVHDSDVYVAGHYIDVAPQFAEEALDEIVSAEELKGERGDDADGGEALQLKRARRVIHSATLRGSIRGALGDVSLYPMAAWHARALDERAKTQGENGGAGGRDASVPRMIAIAGMGHMGSFGGYELRRLGQSLSSTVSRLPGCRRICSVLIGSGVGNLSIVQAVEALATGILRGIQEDQSAGAITLSLVERAIGRAYRMQQALAAFASRQSGVRLLSEEPRREDGRLIPPCDKMTLALASIARSADSPSDSPERKAVARVLEPAKSILMSLDDVATTIREALGASRKGSGDPLLDALTRIDISVREEGVASKVASTRLTCVREIDDAGRGILSFAALSASTVVPKRYNPVDWQVVQDALRGIELLAEGDAVPTVEQMDQYPPMLNRLLIPRDFRPYLCASNGGQSSDSPMVFELDRQTAMINWELLDVEEGSDGSVKPVAIDRQVARQLRTEYSPAPAPQAASREVLRVLVVVSPGEPGDSRYLDAALREGEAIVELLAALPNVKVDVLAGAPHDDRSAGIMKTYPAATRFSVLQTLLAKSRYDILHYSGHAWFDEKDQRKTGWEFTDGVLTASELERVDVVPQLVVANACLSARTAQQSAGKKREVAARDYAPTPGLADEFFKRGVRAYIGTAWSIEDRAASEFATRFYGVLLHRWWQEQMQEMRTGMSAPIGQAMFEARSQLYRSREVDGLAWAAYQHYGDPSLRLLLPGGRS